LFGAEALPYIEAATATAGIVVFRKLQKFCESEDFRTVVRFTPESGHSLAPG
jgi:hypothetical protein